MSPVMRLKRVVFPAPLRPVTATRAPDSISKSTGPRRNVPFSTTAWESATTTVPARVMKREREMGSVEPGKRADLILLDADPLADIHNIRTVRYVVAAGRMFECAPLWRAVGFTP